MPKARKSPEQAPSPAPARGLPKISRRSNEDRQAPKIQRKPPFWLVFVPGRYCVMDGRVVPQLNEFSLETGCNGVLELKDGTLVVDDAEANLRSKGATVIPWDVDGAEGPYLSEVAPKVWVSKWTRTVAGSEFMEPDLVGYAAWLDTLVDRGIVPPPQLHDLERMASAIRFDIEHSSQNPALQPHRVRQLQRHLDVIEDAIEPAREAEEASQRAALAVVEDRRAARTASSLPKVGQPADDGEVP